MIHELAVEPEAVAKWHAHTVPYLKRAFRKGGSACVVKFPERWAKLAHNAAGADSKQTKVMIEHLAKYAVTRPGARYATDERLSWLDNAENEHRRQPFHAIIALAGPAPNGDVHSPDAVHDIIASLPRGKTPPRRGEELARVLEPMLRLANQVVLVDPHADPWEPRYQESFKHLLACAGPRARARMSLVVHSKQRRSEPSDQHFESGARKHLHPLMSPGAVLRVIRVAQIPHGEEFHDRFVLTDLAGVSIGRGLEQADELDTKETFTVQLLDAEVLDTRWRQYTGLNRPDFDIDYEFELNGPAR